MPSHHHLLRAVGACAIAALVVGCGSTHSQVSLPPLAKIVPAGFQPTKLYRADLTGNAVPDLVLISDNGADATFPHGDVQVLSWDAHHHRWQLVFDAQKTDAPLDSVSPRASDRGAGVVEGAPHMTPLLTRSSYTGQTVGQVKFVPLLGSNERQLVFSTSNYSLTAHGTLIVVDLHGAKPDVLYAWNGVGLTAWQVDGKRITATADYFVTYDASCCPARTYQFAVGARDGHITELADDRPFLGAVVQPTSAGDLRVVRVVSGTPAAGHLRAGDVVTVIAGGSKTHTGTLFDQFAFLKAGEPVGFVVRRANRSVTERVKLGSLDSAAAAALVTPPAHAAYPYVAL